MKHTLCHIILSITLLLLIFSCAKEKQEQKRETGQLHELNFENKVIDTEELNILKYLYFYNGAGVAVGNVVGNDLPDIYLVSNQGENKLFENKGNFQFEDVTQHADVAGNASWQTGTAMADINGDGLLDIFVCAVSGIHGFSGHNEVYINQGDGTFQEMSKALGLAQKDYSTAVSFFDYDRDGDLDMYLLNHAVHTEDGYRLPAEKVRHVRTEKVGDRLMRNDDGKFTDVSQQAGILGGKVNYGLAVRVSDINGDSWPDIYVSNDFHENDYLYLNQGNGTFAEVSEKVFDYTSKFSMGNDIADVNNDGRPDIFLADMEPFDFETLKNQPSEDSPEIYDFKLKHGYHRQYARNTLQLNGGAGDFQEVAHLYGVSATDWSWSPLFADFNLDGKQDLFISNGIWRRPNDLDYLKYISTEEIAKQLADGSENDLKVVEKMPQGLVHNFMFLQGDDGFKEVSEQVGFTMNDSTTGATLGDFDNDGDVDIVMNRVNAPALVWENKAKGNYLKIHLKRENGEPAIGAKVLAYQGLPYVNSSLKKQSVELYAQKGFMSSAEPTITIGLPGNAATAIHVLWPNGTITRDSVEVNQIIEMVMPSAREKLRPANTSWAQHSSKKKAQNVTSFRNNPLLPYSSFSVNKKEIQEYRHGPLLVNFSPWYEVEMLYKNEIFKTIYPKGFWLSATSFDKDGDGDLDLLMGNLGQNTRLQASKEKPLRCFVKDFDNNGTEDIILSVNKNGKYYPLLWKDQLAATMPMIKKKYANYSDFADQTVEDIFGKGLKDAVVLEIESLENGWLVNNNGTFTWEPLPFEMQAGPITNSEVVNGALLEVWGSYDEFIPTVGLTTLSKHSYHDGKWSAIE